MKLPQQIFRGLAVAAALAATSLPASADTVSADFLYLNGVLGSTSGGNISFTLNGDGTIGAALTSIYGIEGFGFDSSALNLPESGFSSPVDNASGWSTNFSGSFGSGFYCESCGTSVSWTIGNMGDYASVFDVLDGAGSPFDFFLYSRDGNEWAAIAGDKVSPVPLPAAMPLLLLVLGAVGAAGLRRSDALA